MSEIRQRWRIVFAREEAARYLSHLDAVKGWERAFRRGEIPVATSEGFSPRPKLVFAAPLQLGMLAEHELADLFLAEKLTAPDLRERLAGGMPRGYRVVDLHDVWIGAPAIAPQLTAADYRMTLLNVEQGRLEGAVERLLAAETLPRERHKEKRTVAYDLRPLLLELRAEPPEAAALPPEVVGGEAGIAPGPAAAGIWTRLRHSQNLGSGRADEVVAALGEDLGMKAIVAVEADDNLEGLEMEGSAVDGSAPSTDERPAPVLALEVLRPVRERLWLDEELPTN